ncbi:MAG: cell division protein [Coxiella sp. (in: Bacteria)]|nr:MAG: cell division protein [Coxiella sp. (in: g-proteobacteria)]
MQSKKYTGRFYFVIALLIIAILCIFVRLFFLNVRERSFLVKQSNARTMRDIAIPSYRGMILDRTGSPLAISSPVDAVWVNPKDFKATAVEEQALAKDLNRSISFVQKRVRNRHGREFVYLKRQNTPAVATEIADLHIPGVHLQKEYKRFYPEGEVAAHVVGLTNIDDRGQEGLELAYDKWLSGTAGAREVIKDRKGHVIRDVAILKQPLQGHNLTLGLDHRIQYIAYSAIKQAVSEYHAKSGSVVVLNDKTGEVLAMANAPSYNPNDRPSDKNGRYRNRAVTDMYEPGSVIKSFNIALALQSGKYTPDSVIDTSPGRMRVGKLVVKDDGLNYGRIDLTTILQKSSNIGAAKILMSLPPKNYWSLLHNFGFGVITRSGFPGESPGHFVPQNKWHPTVVATLAYGYGVAVTTLQLAHAYGVLADHGVSVPVSLLKLTKPAVGHQVIRNDVADDVVKMLEAVVERGGTGLHAQIPNYRVAGKTGTAYIADGHGYDKHRYISDFVGMAPASDPDLVVAVVLRDPHGQHFGGLVSAPVFARVMAASLRILDIPPDSMSKK